MDQFSLLIASLPWWMPIAVFFVFGFSSGTLLSLVFFFRWRKSGDRWVEDVSASIEKIQEDKFNAFSGQMQLNLQGASQQALSKSSEELLKASQHMFLNEREWADKTRKQHEQSMDSRTETLAKELERISGLVREFERDRSEKYGALDSLLKKSHEQTSLLMKTTSNLHKVLASPSARGRWGERIAEDVLRSAGFVENINYVRQQTNSHGTRPDFSFLLPKDLRLNMDVKFPIDNYTKYLEAESQVEKAAFKKAFFKDFRNRVKELNSRAYVDPDEGTADCVLLFIPHDQLLAFVQEAEPDLIDQALTQKVVCCSPLTLFAVLAVVRQATEQFAFQQTSHEILQLIGQFRSQWDKYLERMDVMGKRIGDVQKEYEKLITVRQRMLEKPLDRLETLRLGKVPDVSLED